MDKRFKEEKTMLSYDYETEIGKLEKLCKENDLDYEIKKAIFPFIATIRPDREVKNQMRMNLGGEHETFRNGEIKLIFADELTMQIVNDYVIEDNLLNKLKNQIKKLHYIYLQIYFKEKTKLD